MSKPVITVENLSKAYRIGLKEEVPDTLMSAMTGFMKAPLKKFHELRKLDTFRHSGDSEDIYWALKDVSFEVQEGEVLGVIGRNGAGKSTLLKILSRITEPTGGRAVIRGRVSSLLEVGTGFHPELSGRENVYLNGTILGMTKREIDRKFDEIVDFSGVEKFLDTPIKRYSSGMKVRLAFAVAAHLEPEILIIDEVLAVGDAEFQKKCMGKMQDVARGGRTVLFVSHNMTAVSQLCTFGMFLKAGSIHASGEIDHVIASYSNLDRGSACPLIDLSDASRLGQGRGDAKLVKCRRVGDFNEIMPWAFEFNSPIEFQIDVEARSPFPKLDVGIGIVGKEGYEITSSLTGDSGVRHSINLPGVYTYTITFPVLRLMPGTYSMSFGIRSDRGLEDYISNAMVFDVTPSSRFADLILNTRLGGIVPQIECSVTPSICPVNEVVVQLPV